MRTTIAARVHPSLYAHTRAPKVPRYLRYVFVLLPVAAHGAGLDDAFAAMDKTAQQFRSVTADMKRDQYTVLIDEHDKDMGVMKAKREKSRGTMMLIELTGAQPKSIELGGGEAKIYTPKIKNEDIYPIQHDLVDQFFLLGFGSSSAEVKLHYEVTFAATEKVGSDTTWHLQLVPKSAEELKYVKKAELWISQTTGLPVQEKLYTSASGDYNLINYSNVKLNPDLSDKDVKLNLPKGVTTNHPRL
jgi:outer membrane lipoprotein-sorting protein